MELFGSASEELTGKIDYRHVYLNFTNIEVELDNKKVVKTCPAALGPGFAAGTTDGPGVFGFQQGDPEVSVPIVTLCTQHMHLCFFSCNELILIVEINYQQRKHWKKINKKAHQLVFFI